MFNTQTAATTLSTINTSDLPAPDALYSGDYTNNGQNTGASWSAGTVPNVADSGRIMFGACMRLPTSKLLPRPIGSVPGVADHGRVGFGACMRLPASK